jgi:hypothetical protein
VFKRQKHLNHCLRYTALGNSIAFGEGASNDYGYVNYFRDFLDRLYKCVDLSNRAEKGFNSSELLDNLKNNITTRDAVKNADIITLSIGGGNLLDCLKEPDPIACLPGAVATFSNDWPQIVKEIRKSIGSKAEIYVMTVYNPFKANNNDPLFGAVELAVNGINQVIKRRIFRSIYRYGVVDVHADFQGQFTNGQFKVCTWTHFCENTPDPHPTDSGHLEIALLHERAYLKNH